MKDDKYYNDFDHSDNNLSIDCFDEDEIKIFNNMLITLTIHFDTKDTNDTNDPDYPFELVNPHYIINFHLANSSSFSLSNAIIKTDNKRMEFKEVSSNNYETEKDVVAIGDYISVSDLKSIADSNGWSLTLYDEDGDEVASTDSTELKDQIYAGETFYSLTGTEWTFD